VRLNVLDVLLANSKARTGSIELRCVIRLAGFPVDARGPAVVASAVRVDHHSGAANTRGENIQLDGAIYADRFPV
jgi:hypothetical protein